VLKILWNFLKLLEKTRLVISTCLFVFVTFPRNLIAERKLLMVDLMLTNALFMSHILVVILGLMY